MATTNRKSSTRPKSAFATRRSALNHLSKDDTDQKTPTYRQNRRRPKTAKRPKQATAEELIATVLSNLQKSKGVFGKEYHGDLYGTRGTTVQGLVYMSRVRLESKSEKYKRAIAEDAARQIARKARHRNAVTSFTPNSSGSNSINRRESVVQEQNPIERERMFRQQKEMVSTSYLNMIKSRITHEEDSLDIGADTRDVTLKTLITKDKIAESILSLCSINNSDKTHLTCVRALSLLIDREPTALLQSVRNNLMPPLTTLVATTENPAVILELVNFFVKLSFSDDGCNLMTSRKLERILALKALNPSATNVKIPTIAYLRCSQLFLNISTAVTTSESVDSQSQCVVTLMKTITI